QNPVPNPNNYLIIDDIGFSPQAPPIYNADFEHVFTLNGRTPEGWNTFTYVNIDADHMNGPFVASRNYFSPPSDYALQLENVPLIGRPSFYISSSAFTSLNDAGTPFQKNGGFPVQYKHNTVNCYYEFMPAGTDTAVIWVEMTRQGVQVGNG